VDAVIKEFGTIDVLINNAGITRDNLLMRMSEEQWDDVIETNLKSLFNFTKGIIKPMLKARKGSIINITSIVGVSGNAGQSNYSASKAGIIGFTKSMAYEVGSRNIRCNAIAPGFIDTEMTHALDDKLKETMISNTALQRFGQAEEIANACLFLASDLSSYITGEVLMVTGGMR
jgi:3-oxoacyl-[acyl-carrier protein] reductase